MDKNKVYEHVANVQTNLLACMNHLNQFDNTMTKKMLDLDSRLSDVESNLSPALDSIRECFNEMEARIGDLEDKLLDVEASVKVADDKAEHATGMALWTSSDELSARIHYLEKRMGIAREDHKEEPVLISYNSLESRIESLEKQIVDIRFIVSNDDEFLLTAENLSGLGDS